MTPRLINLLYFIFIIHYSYGFIVGGCIGPKSVLERFLNEKQRAKMREIVHTQFDGSNQDEVLTLVNSFVHANLPREQWLSILPEIKRYQQKNHECSIYAQLLPAEAYRPLLKSVWRASEMGASKHEVKRLVEDYVDRYIKEHPIEYKRFPQVVIPSNSNDYRRAKPVNTQYGYAQRNQFVRNGWNDGRRTPFPVNQQQQIGRSRYYPSQYYGPRNYPQSPMFPMFQGQFMNTE